MSVLSQAEGYAEHFIMRSQFPRYSRNSPFFPDKLWNWFQSPYINNYRLGSK